MTKEEGTNIMSISENGKEMIEHIFEWSGISFTDREKDRLRDLITHLVESERSYAALATRELVANIFKS